MRLLLPLTLALLLLTGCLDQPAPEPPPRSAVATSARRWLKTYVDGDGRVVRRDQGGDTVSEGQAYGLLIAELADDDQAVQRIWAWTRDHLRQPTGLLAFHTDAAGKVVDTSWAPDADVLAAFALLRYDGPDADPLHAAGKRLAGSVLDQAVAETSHGPVLIAGPWAAQRGIVDPSYWMPGVFHDLADLTGQGRWADMADASIALLSQATDDGRTLPSDWAQLSGDRLVPIQAPGGGEPVHYGPDAQRVPIFFAAGCDHDATALAARWSDRLATQQAAGATRLDPDGKVADGAPSPLALLATAAGVRAAGDSGRADSLTAQAVQQAQRTPTYYGDAWVVLGRALAEGMLTTC